jgi:multiple sugar transport system substrate-binding protein
VAVITAAGAAGAARPESGGPVTVRWYVGLGTGTQPEQIAVEEAVVESFNAGQDSIELQLEVVQREVAYETLAARIDAGDAPDIIGPLGVLASNSFAGQFLDLGPLVESTGFDLSGYEPAQVEFWREGSGELTALPFAVSPSAMFYNVELFDAAGLEYPPADYGQPYADGDPWDMDKVLELALLLTLDGNGNDATNPDFDRENIVQWGFHHQFNDDARSIGTFFAPGTFVADDGTAQIPEQWIEAWQWYVDLIAAGGAPNQSEIESAALGAGNAFNTGNVAMANAHLWYTCCIRDEAGAGRQFWDLAVMPEYEGTATSKLQADTFRILSSTENPEAAFDVLTYLLDEAAPLLLDAYDALSARQDLAAPYLAELDEVFPQRVSWDAALAGLEFPDIPSYESNMPNSVNAELVIDTWDDQLTTQPNLDVPVAAEDLRLALDQVFAGAAVPTATVQPQGPP